ncbi:hypothetical protein B0H11DRAFT_1948188 [Mycena galericulata]|nr:hypothetical protein B0H11DRAFT_1948188 [Mycena galericulata]
MDILALKVVTHLAMGLAMAPATDLATDLATGPAHLLEPTIVLHQPRLSFRVTISAVEFPSLCSLLTVSSACSAPHDRY